MRPVSRIVFGLSLFLLALAALAVTHVFSAPAPISQTEYWALVEQTRTDLSALDGKSPEEIRLALNRMADTWSGVTEVQQADGTVVPVDVSYLVAAFHADPPPDPKRLEGLLSVLLDIHEAGSSSVSPSQNGTTQNEDSLNKILLRPEFQWKPNPIGEWIQKMWDKFAAWLDSILNGVDISLPREPFTIAAVILLLGVLAYVFRGLFTDLVKETNVDESTDEDDRNLTSETAFRKAQNLSGQGDYRAAVRYLYLSSLLMMEERGILRYDRSRTNREYLRSVSAHPNLAKPLKSVVDVFDRVWYGYEPLDESTYKEYVDEVEELKEQKE